MQTANQIALWYYLASLTGGRWRNISHFTSYLDECVVHMAEITPFIHHPHTLKVLESPLILSPLTSALEAVLTFSRAISRVLKSGEKAAIRSLWLEHPG